MRLNHILDIVRGQTVVSLRRKGAEIGDNVILDRATIDKNTACLVKIGNNVTITESLILAHDAVTTRRLRS